MKMENKSDLSDFECNMVVGVSISETDGIFSLNHLEGLKRMPPPQKKDTCNEWVMVLCFVDIWDQDFFEAAVIQSTCYKQSKHKVITENTTCHVLMATAVQDNSGCHSWTGNWG